MKNLCLVKFDSHRPRGSWDISFFISRVTSCGHVIIGSNLPSVVAISLVEVEIWHILIFNVTRRIYMIILLQSVTVQFRRLFWHISCYKVQQSNFVTKCDRLLLQSASGIKKCGSYKVRRNTFTKVHFPKEYYLVVYIFPCFQINCASVSNYEFYWQFWVMI